MLINSKQYTQHSPPKVEGQQNIDSSYCDITKQFGAAGCKILSLKQAKDRVKWDSYSQVRTQSLLKDLPVSRKQKCYC
jgi:hypothetical protein